ncbi:MAG: glycosyltransferase family 8 protein [Planctomycetia bacterium]|nr:glycosyltransferase family 8 protein [Planctomycetia bacterium]
MTEYTNIANDKESSAAIYDPHVIQILLIADHNYAPFLATTIRSILDNAAADDRLFFHIVDAGLLPDDLQKLQEMQNDEKFQFKRYNPDLNAYLRYMRRDISSFPAVVNYRLFAEKYLPQDLKKVLYLDVDIIVLKSLKPLWETELKDAFLAARDDPYIRKSHIERLGCAPNHRYFNSGVLLMNLQLWREKDVLSELLDLSIELHDRVEFPDQDLLNAYAARHGYLLLQPRWNSHPRDYSPQETVVLHYMGSRLRCPRLDLLYSYAQKTPYRRLPMQGRAYQFKSNCKRVFCNVLCFFFFPRKIRRAIRKRFNLR